MKDKPQKVKTVSQHFDSDFKKLNPNIKLVNLETELKIARKKLNSKYQILENQNSTLDEAIKLCISIHNFNKSNYIEENYAHTFIVLSANIINYLIAIRDNLQNGLLNSAKILFRSLMESSQIFQACLFDSELKNRFMNLEMYDNNDFYFQNFSRNKLYQKCIDFYKSLDLEEKRIEYFTERKKYLTKFLSESVHSSYNAANSNYIMFSLDFEDISNDVFGKITTGYPKIITAIIEEIAIINFVYKKHISKNISDFNQGTNEFKIYDFYSDKFGQIVSLYLDDFNLFTKEVNTKIEEIKKLMLE